MKTGDQILFYKSGVIGNLIGFFTKSKFSHVGTMVVLNKMMFVIEADGFSNDVKIQDFESSTKGRKYKILKLKKPLKNKRKFIKDLPKLTKFKYDFKSLFRFAITKNAKENNDSFICSELSAYILENYHDLDINTSEITPSDFIKNGKIRKLFRF